MNRCHQPKGCPMRNFIQFIALVSVTLMVSGCAGQFANLASFTNKVDPEVLRLQEQRRQEAIAAYNAAITKCEGVVWTRKTAYDKQKCLNEAEKINPEPKVVEDIQNALATENLKTALDYSEGKISKQRFMLAKDENVQKAEFAQKEFARRMSERMQQEAFQQEQISEMKRARRAQAFQALNQNLQQQQFMQQQQFYQQQQLMRLNRPVTTNCNRFGNSFNCTSW